MVELFRQLSTQWRMAVGMGGAVYLGLDYSAVWALMQLLDLPKRADLFADLQVMELAALRELNRKRS